MSKKKIAVAAIAAGAVVASAFSATAANADPSAQAIRTYSAVGSDTIQDLYNSFSNGYGTTAALSGVSINSYNAFGSSIQPVNATTGFSANSIGRPSGSGDGRKALSAAWNPASASFIQTINGTAYSFQVTPKSIDIARSSGKPGTIVTAGATNDNLTSVPLARDAVSVATFGFSYNFTTAQLEAIYGGANDTAAGGSATAASGTFYQGATPVFNASDIAASTGLTAGDIARDTTSTSADPVLITAVDGSGHPTGFEQLHPILPQSSSGTRSFFLGAVNKGNTAATWVAEGVSENTASVLSTSANIIPFSAAQWIAQQNGIAPSTGIDNSNDFLNQVNGNAPYTTSTTLVPGALFGSLSAAPTGTVGTFSRDVYSVVATQNINTNTALRTLVSSTLPASANITAFGFAQLGYTADSTTWLHSPFEAQAAATFGTATGLTASVNSDKTVSVTAKVTAGAAAAATTIGAPSGAPAGTVTFTEGATTLASVDVDDSGVATATISGLSVGAIHAITATFTPVSSTTAFPYVFTTSNSSASVGIPAAATPVLTAGSVSVVGTAKVGSKLAAKVGSFGSGASLFLQWKANGAAIAGATGSSFVPTAAQLGKSISLSVTAVKSGYISAANTSSATAKVAAGSLTVGKVAISGTAKVGKTLTAKTGTWTSGTKFTFVWKASGKTIKGATHSTLKLSSKVYKGKKITVTVTGKLAGYTTVSKSSASTKSVAK